MSTGRHWTNQYAIVSNDHHQCWAVTKLYAVKCILLEDHFASVLLTDANGNAFSNQWTFTFFRKIKFNFLKFYISETILQSYAFVQICTVC